MARSESESSSDSSSSESSSTSSSSEDSLSDSEAPQRGEDTQKNAKILETQENSTLKRQHESKSNENKEDFVRKSSIEHISMIIGAGSDANIQEPSTVETVFDEPITSEKVNQNTKDQTNKEAIGEYNSEININRTRSRSRSPLKRHESKSSSNTRDKKRQRSRSRSLLKRKGSSSGSSDDKKRHNSDKKRRSKSIDVNEKDKKDLKRRRSKSVESRDKQSGAHKSHYTTSTGNRREDRKHRRSKSKELQQETRHAQRKRSRSNSSSSRLEKLSADKKDKHKKESKKRRLSSANNSEKSSDERPKSVERTRVNRRSKSNDDYAEPKSLRAIERPLKSEHKDYRSNSADNKFGDHETRGLVDKMDKRQKETEKRRSGSAYGSDKSNEYRSLDRRHEKNRADFHSNSPDSKRGRREKRRSRSANVSDKSCEERSTEVRRSTSRGGKRGKRERRRSKSADGSGKSNEEQSTYRDRSLKEKRKGRRSISADKKLEKTHKRQKDTKKRRSRSANGLDKSSKKRSSRRSKSAEYRPDERSSNEKREKRRSTSADGRRDKPERRHSMDKTEMLIEDKRNRRSRSVSGQKKPKGEKSLEHQRNRHSKSTERYSKSEEQFQKTSIENDKELNENDRSETNKKRQQEPTDNDGASKRICQQDRRSESAEKLIKEQADFKATSKTRHLNNDINQRSNSTENGHEDEVQARRSKSVESRQQNSAKRRSTSKETRRENYRRSKSIDTSREKRKSRRSTSQEYRRKDRRSKSVENHRQEERRSKSLESRRRDRANRRSESLERRREERKRRHAEQEMREHKRTRHDQGINNEKEKNTETNDSTLQQPTTNSENSTANDNATVTDPKAKITERQRRTVDLLTSRTGGAYIPPAKLRLMQAEITDKSSAAFQRIAWEALKKSIHGYINKVNVDNIAIITRELLKENIVRGRGLLCRSIIQAQAASPTFTHVYAALVAIINSKFPNIGELLLKRLVIQFKRAFRRNDKAVCLSSSRFIAHLVNQRVAHEILALEILTLLVETPTDDSVEVAIAFLKECGMKLTEVSSKGIGAIFEMLKNILHEGKLEKRVQYMIEVVFQVRKDGFKDHQSVIESLELVEEDDQFTHLMMLDEANDTEDILNVFKFDEQYQDNEEKYKGLSKEILGSDASDSDGGGSSQSDSDDSSGSGEDNEEKTTAGDIIDNTETNLIALRRTIYLTINSSLDYEECAHKLMKMQLKPGQEIELCHMFLDCCAEQRTYEKFYGLLAQRFCTINRIYVGPFEEIFKSTYQTTHRLDTNRLRNVSKFFAHLLFTDAIGWDVLECIRLNEDDTTSSSRIFIKILFQELAEYMGLSKLNSKLKDDVLTESLAGLFPKDNPRNTRFAINFFTSIGLGGLTDELRQFLKNAPKSVPAINIDILSNKPAQGTSSDSSSSSSSTSSSSSSSSSSDSSSSSSSSSSSDSSSSSSESETGKKKRKRKKNEDTKRKRQNQKKKAQKKQRDIKKAKSAQKKKQENDSSGSESDSESSSSSSTSDSSSDSELEKIREKLLAKKKLSDARKRQIDSNKAEGGDEANDKRKRSRNDDKRTRERDDEHRNQQQDYERRRDTRDKQDKDRRDVRNRERANRDDKVRSHRDERENRRSRENKDHHRSSRNYSKERG